METLRLYWPVKPFSINQVFGANPDYYAKFHDSFGNPLKGHNGLDLRAAHGTPVYAACDGLVHYEKDDHGGEGMVIRTGRFAYKGGTATFNVIHWHLIGDTDPLFPSPVPLDGHSYAVTAGDLIGYTDNTGAPFESLGDHLHMGVIPFDDTGKFIDQQNGFDGRIDPTTFFTGIYAQDVTGLISYYTALVEALQKLLALIKK